MDGAELTAEIGIPVCASWPRTAGKQLKAAAGVACQNCAGRFGVPLQYSFGADTTRYLFFFSGYHAVPGVPCGVDELVEMGWAHSCDASFADAFSCYRPVV